MFNIYFHRTGFHMKFTFQLWQGTKFILKKKTKTLLWQLHKWGKMFVSLLNRISVRPCSSKILYHFCVYNFLNDNYVLNDYKFSRSAVHALLHFTDFLSNGFGKNHFVPWTYRDLFRVFDNLHYYISFVNSITMAFGIPT